MPLISSPKLNAEPRFHRGEGARIVSSATSDVHLCGWLREGDAKTVRRSLKISNTRSQQRSCCKSATSSTASHPRRRVRLEEEAPLGWLSCCLSSTVDERGSWDTIASPSPVRLHAATFAPLPTPHSLSGRTVAPRPSSQPSQCRFSAARPG